ncbi:PREDICTED: prisilkin-39-like [Dinoponera quadriceps]|uniref:Prisilkin-39-like n=1 Tax=Dinoponera quadriceps TaxID=609295 RepID=A0A6P3Y504_DINQU|nr:PREDICTED: prisilkin-39-like [Dinoponera quadriceps]
MLLSAVIICCIVIVNAESSLNSYSLTGDNNGYDYGSTDYNNADYSSTVVANNGYLGSKDSYLNGGNFYNDRDTGYKLSNHVGSHSLINGGNQGNIGSDMASSYSKYPTNDHGSDYSGYSKTYENPDGDSYSLSNHAASNPFKGYSGFTSNVEHGFNAYSGGSVQKDSDFGQYTAGSNSNSQRIPAYSAHNKPTMLENYSEDTADSDVRAQGYHGFSGISSYSESDHIYPPYPPAGEYPFGKQKDGLYSNLKGGNKYNDIHSMSTATRYTRGNAGHSSHNHGASSLYLSSSGPSGHLSKTHGSGVYYSTGKPYKYGYKYSSRYAPNSGITYLTRERDSHYTPYGKGSGKVIIIKDSRPSYANMYSDSPYIGAPGGYRSKSSGFMSAYSSSPNFDRYGGTSSNYDDGSIIPRRFRASGGPMILQKTVYS